MKEIIIFGRGGLGAVTTGQILALAAFYDNKQATSFPMFGVERRGAPVEAFVRISNKKIKIKSQIYKADYAIVLDSSLIDIVNIKEKLKPKAFVVVNSNKKITIKSYTSDCKVYSIDATTIALEVFKKPIVNTAILGSFAKLTKLISLKSIKKAIEEVLKEKGKNIVELNKKAVELAYEKTG